MGRKRSSRDSDYAFENSRRRSSNGGSNKRSHSYETRMFINNRYVNASQGNTFDDVSPTTGRLITTVEAGTKEDVDFAVKCARKAFKSWSKEKPDNISKMLFKLADLFDEHKEKIATLDVIDMGKPYAHMLGVDMRLAIECLRYFAGWTDKHCGKTVPNSGGCFTYTRMEPFGVCGCIVPWNFPILMLVWKLAPCIACGNCMIIKPAEQSPLSAIYIGKLIVEAGFPPGVINIVPGMGPTAGAALSSHMDIDKIAFTGSTEVGRLIMQAAAKSNLKDISLELGGKSPLIVCDDFPVDEAVNIAKTGLFFNQGEVCCASSRIYVQSDIYDDFVEAATEMARTCKVGDPFDEDTFFGAVVDQDQYRKIQKFLKLGVEEGATLCCGGKAKNGRGFYIEPTVFSDVDESMAIGKEEIFGPVMSIFRFDTVQEALERANDNYYGLAAGILTKDLDVAINVAHELKAGTVWINTWNEFYSNMPFGGYKQSGIKRDLGEYALDTFSQVKTVIMKLSPMSKSSDFNMNRPSRSKLYHLSAEEAAEYLTINGFGQYKSNFLREDVSGADLSDLDNEDLKDLGVSKMGHRKAMLRLFAN